MKKTLNQSFLKRLPITAKELAGIQRSVDQAWKKLALKYHQRLYPPEDLKEAELFLQKIRKEKLCFSNIACRRVVNHAMKRNDLVFFVRLGESLRRRLSRHTISHILIPLPRRIETFLVSHWAEAKDGLPELFYLTPEGLADVIEHQIGCDDLTVEAVVKLRQRLGLKPSLRKKVHFIRIGMRFVKVDK